MAVTTHEAAGTLAVPDVGTVSTLTVDPASSRATLVLGHGAGADMRHASMAAIAAALAARGIATLRFNFPFKEAGKARVDAKPVATATVRAAVAAASGQFDRPIFLGGHSFGGRMASHAMVDHNLAVAGLIYCSFPLHPAGKPSIARAEHLDAIAAPSLFLSGTRDKLADAELLTAVTARIGATLAWLETADHGYKVLKRSRQRDDDVFSELAGHASDFVDRVARGG